MKTAEELIADITKWDGALHRETVVDIARHIQKETIEETVRRCASESTMTYYNKTILYKVADEIKKELGL